MTRHIVIAGGSGFLGRRLAAELATAEGTVSILTRRTAQQVGTVAFVPWTPSEPGDWVRSLEGADAVINLCGESIAGPRWSEARKRQLIDSRVLPTRTLLRACAACARPPKRFLQASGVGFYGTGANEYSETGPQGDDFLANLAGQWEAPLAEQTVPGMSSAVMRLGVVLGTRGGALPQMLLPFRMFMGGPIGNGQQWLSWLHIEDAVAAIRHLLEVDNLARVYNLSGPEPVRNHQFAESAARALGRPNWVPLPKAVMKLLLGEQSTLVCDGQRGLPSALTGSGFKFKYSTLERALNNLIGK
jgi:uncharacterized protein (TIGR01777 family)